MAESTATITIDGVEVEAPAHDLLIAVAERAGTYIPRFCWHKRMQPVGMCRMCLVEVETPRGVALVTACTTLVADGMAVDTKSEKVKKAQEGILEFLLINHPLDCPVCDRGGECPLQDQTMAYGPGESRFVEEKRHFPKPIPISDLVMLDRERCILCARCTRFSAEISGDPLIEFVERGYGTQVLTFPDEPFTSYFSGNTVEICPVGALTAVPYRFRARPWDLEAVESTCMDCAVGCRASVQSSQNRVVRMNGIDSDPVNHGWLCDRGRFGFEAVESTERLRTPMVRGGGGKMEEVDWGRAVEVVAERLGALGAGRVAGIGGAGVTNEEAYAFSKFLRTVADTPHVDAQLGDGLDPQLLAAVTPRAAIADLERAGAVLVWGPDLKEELPVLYLRVRRAAQELGAALVVVHPRRTGLDDVATHKITYRPGQGGEVLGRLTEGDGDLAGARAVLGEGPVVALVGRTGLAEGPALAEAVAAFARTLPDAGLLPLATRGNVYGALDMGLAPTLLPGRVSANSEEGRRDLEHAWGPLPEGPAKDTEAILEAAAAGDIEALVLLGADVVGEYPDADLAQRALTACPLVVVLDTLPTATSDVADVVLPIAGFAESEGTVTNLEGRVQKVNKIVPAPGDARPSWSVLEDVARAMGSTIGATSAEALGREIAHVAPAYAGITWEALGWGAGRDGIVVPTEEGTQSLAHIPVPTGVEATVPAAMSLHLAGVLYDDAVGIRHTSNLSRLTPAAAAYLTPSDAARIGVAEGEAVRVATNGSAVELPARLDPSLAEGTVYVPYLLPGTRGLPAQLAVTVTAAETGG